MGKGDLEWVAALPWTPRSLKEPLGGDVKYLAGDVVGCVLALWSQGFKSRYSACKTGHYSRGKTLEVLFS